MKKTVWLLAAVIVFLVIGLSYYAGLNEVHMRQQNEQGSIYIGENDSTYRRFNAMYEGFQHHKGDSMMLILSSVDSGPHIYNIISNGSVLYWSVDETRDGYSLNREAKTYECSGISRDETATLILFSASSCKGYGLDERLGSISFSKEDLIRPNPFYELVKTLFKR